MKKLEDLIEVTGYVDISGSPDREIGGLCFDSRHVSPGDLFFAVRGTHTDGHSYIDSAIKKGAEAVICEAFPDQLNKKVCYIKVNSSASALGQASSEFYAHPSKRIKLTGITGTNGKTTTATLLYRLFMKLGHKSGLISTVNYLINDRVIPATHTTPDSLTTNRLLSEMVDAGCEYCFMEVSSHAIAQSRISGLTFSGGIFTNVSHDHLDYHSSFSDYIRVKKQFFDTLDNESFALVNKDDRNASLMVQNTKARVKTYALRTMADYRGGVIESDFGGMLLNLDGYEVWTGFIGNFNASNILAVYAAAILLGAPRGESLRIISSLKPVEGRFETFRSAGKVTAIVDYAHTPDALENVIMAIKQLMKPEAELITVAGAGGDRDKDKRPRMARIASENSEKVILTSDNPRSEDPDSIINDMLSGVSRDFRDRVICISNREEAIKAACLMAKAGDYVLIAGKGHETYQEVKGARYHFDDREVVRSVFNEMQNIV